MCSPLLCRTGNKAGQDFQQLPPESGNCSADALQTLLDSPTAFTAQK
jgi:hypothetical protein